MSKRYFVAVFEDEEHVKQAVRAAREHRYAVEDVHAPYAVHGLDEAMGLRPSRLSWACLAFAIFGASIGIWLQIWTSATDWPINVGGKPFNSMPAFVPVTFELAVLFAGLGSVATLFVRSRLFPGKTPTLPDPRVTDDQFALVIEETDAAFDPTTACRLFETHQAVWCGELIDGHMCRLSEQPRPFDVVREAHGVAAEPDRHVGSGRSKHRDRSVVGVGHDQK